MNFCSIGSAKQRRRLLKGLVKSTKQKDGFNRNGNLQQLRMGGTTAELQCMRLSVTSSYIKHDGCLLSLCSCCDTVLVEQMDEAKAKWLQLAAMAKDELQGMRLSVTSSCMKHDGCLLSQQYCDLAVNSVDGRGMVKWLLLLLWLMCFKLKRQTQHPTVHTILCNFKFYVKLAKFCQH
jgi:hypothetical protein